MKINLLGYKISIGIEKELVEPEEGACIMVATGGRDVGKFGKVLGVFPGGMIRVTLEDNRIRYLLPSEYVIYPGVDFEDTRKELTPEQVDKMVDELVGSNPEPEKEFVMPYEENILQFLE